MPTDAKPIPFVLFAATLFLSSALIFLVEPLVGKMLLPLLGGAPAVWNTCMFFFQAVLLTGYAVAHLLSSRVQKWNHQFIIFFLLMVAALVFLPLRISESWIRSLPTSGSPVLWLLACLGALVGLPFLVLSATGPLLQRWFVVSESSSGRNPYLLYAASNAGSFAALVGYPLLVEPGLRLAQQTQCWTWLYSGFILLTLFCGMSLWRRKAGRTIVASATSKPSVILIGQKLRWLVLSFVPSSLMMGVTNYLTTDIASIPLLWVIPLALYLLTFIVVFSGSGRKVSHAVLRMFPFAVVALVFLILLHSTQPAWLHVLLHLLVFFLAVMLCHRQLADERPAPASLTEFYLWISAGGMLGGAFNALLAPLVFKDITEYPLAIVLACLLQPRKAAELKIKADVAWILGCAALTTLLLIVLGRLNLGTSITAALAFGPGLVLAICFLDRPWRFAFCLTGLLWCGSLFVTGDTVHVERSFFGVSRIRRDSTGRFHEMVHGNTVHGRQFIAEDRWCESGAYYHPDGPVGDIFGVLDATDKHIGVIGLGSGAMATFSRSQQEWTFYEIDPGIIRLAQNTRYFHFLADCAKARFSFVPGDARLQLHSAPQGHFDLIVLDAFSSDAIPVHLLTREAMRLYLDKLCDDGVIAVHISNRFLNLLPIIGNLAEDSRLTGLSWNDSTADSEKGKDPSHWVVLARRKEHLRGLERFPRWSAIAADPRQATWTDDFSNVLNAVQWH